MATIQGDTYAGALHQQGTRDIRIAGANLPGRKSMRLAGGSELTAQAYWDFTERKQPGAFSEHLNTIDLQLQSSSTLAERHRIAWGAGYRLAFDRIDNGAAFAFLPGDLKLHWGNAFVQDEIDLTDTVRLVAGAKVEHNNYTGTEFLPTLRLAWKPTGSSLAWASASRTVRAPSRIDRDSHAPTNPAIVNGAPAYALAGGPDFRSEVADVFELGYRIQAPRPCPGRRRPSPATTSACARSSRIRAAPARCSATWPAAAPGGRDVVDLGAIRTAAALGRPGGPAHPHHA
ncbi:MAG: Iron complex outerrane recepter protein [Massilia sp.]|nr:Iron complex outerrane recepter protein [Massilia sp.]